MSTPRNDMERKDFELRLLRKALTAALACLASETDSDTIGDMISDAVAESPDPKQATEVLSPLLGKALVLSGHAEAT